MHINLKRLQTVNNKVKEIINKKVKVFIQINIGEENHKSGILLNDLDNFYKYCIKDLSLNIIGLMCLPPANLNPQEYFQILKKKL